MNQNILISVIVPIYNVEKYLNQAIDSILAQTHKNLEVILVNDGSKDNCGQICNEYASKDNRIKVIHKENGGLGAAYNTGIEMAAGDYIAFVEPDDYIDANMYEVMLKNAIKYNTDATKCGFYYYNSNKETQNDIDCAAKLFGVSEPDNSFTIDDYPYLCAYHSSIWTYLYRADFVKQIKFVEVKGSAAYVDAPFGFEMLCRAKSISIVPQAFYHWRVEDHGNSVSFRDRRAIQMAYRFCEAKNIIKKYNKYNSLKELFYLHAANANIGFFLNTEDKYKQEYFDKLQELFIDIKYDKDFKWTYTKRYKKVISAINSNNYRKTLKFDFNVLYTNIFQRLFSIKNLRINKQKYKVITILGVKIKTKKNLTHR